MASYTRILRLLTSTLGVLGLVGCIAGVVLAWNARARLRQATENAFAAIDDSMVTLRERITQTQARLEASKVATEDMAEALRNWSAKEAKERLSLQFDLVDGTARLEAALRQADHAMEFSASAAEWAQKALSVVGSAGATADTTSLDRLTAEITSLRLRLADTTEVVARIRESTAGASEEKVLAERIEQAARLTIRVGATLGSIDPRLATLETMLSETQANILAARTRILRWMLLATVAVSLLAIWMAAGQAALCVLAWTSSGRTRQQ
jgi:hypothetical protein